MTPLKFVMPTEFSNAAMYKRIGAIIWDRASNKIVGHVQELAGWQSVASLPLTANPLGLAVKAVGSAIQSAQLHKIQQTVNTIQTLATIGAVASVATLGVSIAGFAMVMARLDRMEGKLDQLLEGNEAVHQVATRLDLKGDLRTRAQLNAALGQQAVARKTSDEGRRQALLSASVERLAELRHFYAGLLASEAFSSAIRTDDLLAVTDAQERLVAACLGELLGEFLLGDDQQVLAERQRQQQQLFENICWKGEQDLHAMVLRGDRAAGIDLVVDPAHRVERVKAVVSIREESSARLDAVVQLAGYLRERDVTPMAYLQEVEQKSAESDEPLVILDAQG